MKEATGELNMTVITLIAVAAVGAIFYFAVWPLVQTMLMNNTCATYGVGYKAQRVKDQQGASESQSSGSAKVYKWECCPTGSDGSIDTDTTKCIQIDED